MRITFVVMGWENISVEYLSSYLKCRGHDVRLAYEQALFDDKNYLCIPTLAKLFDQGNNIIRQIYDSKPDIIAFSVMVFNYQWAITVAEKIRNLLPKIPIIFGGNHAISCPERIIARSCVDIVCIGEGEHAIADLLDSLSVGRIDTSIKGLWFKTPSGEIIKNERRPLIADLDEMPFPDKDLFASVVPIKNYYLAVTNRGCPFNCTYCSVSFQTELEKEIPNYKKIRERSVDNVIEELKINKRKFHFRWVDFRNAVFSANPEWIMEFCEKYKRLINLPFRVFGHPLLIREDTTHAMKEAGCFAIQMGLESYDPYVRNNILNRRETNEQIHSALEILERCKINYSLDFILGLPKQGNDELEKAADLFSKLQYCYRMSPFIISYLPKVPIVDIAIQHGMMNESEKEVIEEGFHGNYMDTGSKMEKSRRKMIEVYKMFFRSMSFMPIWVRKLVKKLKLYHIFKFLPGNYVIRFFDLIMVLRDRDATAYFLNYLWWFRMRFKKDHPNSF